MQQQLTQALDSLRVLKSAGMSFGADDNGFRIRTATILDEERAKTLGVLQEDFEPTLLDRVPATTLAYVGFQDLGPMIKKTIDQFSGQSPQIAQALTAVEAMTGASFDGEIVPLLSGEHALYVAPGNPGPIPAVGLLLKPADAAKGAATIKKLTGDPEQGALGQRLGRPDDRGHPERAALQRPADPGPQRRVAPGRRRHRLLQRPDGRRRALGEPRRQRQVEGAEEGRRRRRRRVRRCSTSTSPASSTRCARPARARSSTPIRRSRPT